MNIEQVVAKSIFESRIKQLESIYRESFPGLSGSYSEEMRLAIGDAITMLRLLCKQEGFDFYELLKEGEARFKKRQDDIARHKQ